MYFSFLYLRYIILLYTDLVTIFFITYIALISHLYMMMCVIIHLSLHALFLFIFLYTCFFMYAILYFCFILRCLDEFCLKCFRKTSCQNLSCHEFSSCKIFQEFVLGLDLLYLTSDYEFSDL